ncbi:PREDICTED: protein regulator of cytokinesis 1 [Dipodomys ordii]|uniref:Protein regulator of cytokinesis 1 n=1 Tax=Dipodomys ordii TaxID=10020 RepID=A0A1S3ETP8_DIPOR|nr:PREDICTED: protein regulator of cytokinesis 1 [Dipodomys ordii]
MRRSEVLAEESVVCLQKALIDLREIWELIGIPEDQRLQRTEVVKKHIKDLLDRMIAEEESLKERLIKSISVCQKELDTLCSELRVEPFQEEGEVTILQLEKDLRTQVELMRKQKKDRKQELKLLKEQDQELCEILCVPHYDIDSMVVPSIEDLNQLRKHVTSLRETKNARREEFVNIKRQIILCMEELEHTPDTSFERDVACEDEDAFCLSLENIATLQKLLQQSQRKASDPSRFTNRGGNLLKEEKQRAKLQKTLPKLEEELKAQIEMWEREHSQSFVVNGKNFMDYVAEQWQLHQLEKELAKQERQLKNKKQTETEMLYGSAPRTPKRRGLTPNTAGKVRKLNSATMSNATANSSLRPVLGSTMYRSPMSRLPPSGSKPVMSSTCSGKKTPRAGRHGANKENVELNGSFLSGGYPDSAPLQRNFSVNSVASTYSEFAKEPALSDSSAVGLQRELSKASKSDAASRILNSTNIHS